MAAIYATGAGVHPTAASAHVDYCSAEAIDRLYGDPSQGEFCYSLPKPVLTNYFDGLEFGGTVPGTPAKTPYSAEDREKLKNDANEIVRDTLAQNPARTRHVVLTGGAPGVGKSWYLKNWIVQNDREGGPKHAEVGPDDVSLPKQRRTFLQDIEQSDKSPTERLRIYNKWRNGSNGILHLSMAQFIKTGCSFAYHCAGTHPLTIKFFEFLQANGYSITLKYIGAPDDVRWASVAKRDREFIQTTEADVRKKGTDVVERMNDTYFYCTSDVQLYYRGGVDEAPQLAAEWVPGRGAARFPGTLTILNPEAYKKLKAIHNLGVAVLAKPELTWEKSVESPERSVIVLAPVRDKAVDEKKQDDSSAVPPAIAAAAASSSSSASVPASAPAPAMMAAAAIVHPTLATPEES